MLFVWFKSETTSMLFVWFKSETFCFVGSVSLLSIIQIFFKSVRTRSSFKVATKMKVYVERIQELMLDKISEKCDLAELEKYSGHRMEKRIFYMLHHHVGYDLVQLYFRKIPRRIHPKNVVYFST